MAAMDKFVSNLKAGFYAIIIIAMIAIIYSGLALGITDIVIGAKYLHNDCHIHDLAEYLIVMGVFSIINFIILTTKDETPDGKKNFSKKYEYVFSAISCVIAIWGMILIWDTNKGDCASTLYNYAYYRTIIIVFIMTAVLASIVILAMTLLVHSCCCEAYEEAIISSKAESNIEITNANTKTMPGGISSNDKNEFKKLNELTLLFHNDEKNVQGDSIKKSVSIPPPTVNYNTIQNMTDMNDCKINIIDTDTQTVYRPPIMGSEYSVSGAGDSTEA